MHLISHFFNEEFLLPFWLKHHVPLFDHGVMIDYGSTDRSVEIIRELAPDWEIRPTRNAWFVEPQIGREVMDVEKEFKGWKMALNTTEFILHPDLRSYTKSLGVKPGICTTGVIIVDHPDERGQYNDELLVAQKTNGYFEVDILTKGLSTTRVRQQSRRRLLHQQPCGKYSGGRHNNQITKEQADDLYLCWFGWAPFTQEMKDRKKQIQHKCPPKQKSRPSSPWVKCYCVDDSQLEKMYEDESGRSYDLLATPKYQKALQKFQDARR
jgi:hypothetical protein